jgi:hypothetical protein
MKNKFFLFIFLLTLLLPVSLFAAEVTKEQMKGLDEQVQEIKKDILSISVELNHLEEKLLFPSNTQVSFFVSLAEVKGFQPDAVKIKLDGKDVAHHIYSYKEVEALQNGGVQRVYTGNVASGEHVIEVSIAGRQDDSKKTDTKSHKLNKGVGPQFVEIRLSSAGVEFQDW